MNIDNKYDIEYELSKHVTDTEMERIERTKRVFEFIKNEDEMISISKKKNIPLGYLKLISTGSIIASEQVLKLLEGIK